MLADGSMHGDETWWYAYVLEHWYTLYNGMEQVESHVIRVQNAVRMTSSLRLARVSQWG
jgi:hypothetical protein